MYKFINLLFLLIVATSFVFSQHTPSLSLALDNCIAKNPKILEKKITLKYGDNEDSTSRIRTFEYDSLGNLITRKDSYDISTYTYKKGRLVREVCTRISDNYILDDYRYLYDSNNKLACIQNFNNDSSISDIEIFEETDFEKKIYSYYFTTYPPRFHMVVKRKNNDTLNEVHFTPLTDGRDFSFKSYSVDNREKSYRYTKGDTIIDVRMLWADDYPPTPDISCKIIEKKIYDNKGKVIYFKSLYYDNNELTREAKLNFFYEKGYVTMIKMKEVEFYKGDTMTTYLTETYKYKNLLPE